MANQYKPSEHDGLTKSGEPDKRVTQGTETSTGFAHGKLDPHEIGQKGGSVTGGDELHQAQQNEIGDNYKPSENDGLTKEGKPDKRMKGNE